MIEGIVPILFTPFDEDGDIDAPALRRITRFEMDGGVHGIGINGFASEAYKLSDAERHRNAEIVSMEVAGQLPLIIGIAPVSAEVAIQQAREYARYRPSALMALPPSTMDNGTQALVEFYVELGRSSDVPIMVQQAPHIPQYRHTALPAEALAEIADRAPTVQYFKIEGPGSADRMRALASLLGSDRKMFGGGGGITVLGELRGGAAGLIPGVGFNEIFLAAWEQWIDGDADGATEIIQRGDALVKAVSGAGHETSLHLRKQLMKRAGYMNNAYVRRPTIAFDDSALTSFFGIVDALNLRVSRRRQHDVVG